MFHYYHNLQFSKNYAIYFPYISDFITYKFYLYYVCYFIIKLYVNLPRAQPEDGCKRGVETCCCYNCLIIF
jgi:hypothetical protein